MNRRMKLTLGAVIAVVLAGVASAAWAFWTTSGSGTAGASVATLDAPTNVQAESNTGGVTVTWTNSTPPAGTNVDGYYVERSSGAGWSYACNTGPVAPGLIPASGADPTCADSPADGTYRYRVTAVWRTWTATSGPSGEVTVVGDTSKPVATITFPANATKYNGSAFGAGCNPTGICGTATDSSGVSVVRVSIMKQTGDQYWNGSAFASATEVFNNATVSPSNGTSVAWNYPFPLPADGSYTVHVQAKDTRNNQQTGTEYAVLSTFTIDNTAPTVQSVSSTLADGAYKAGQEVPVTVTFSEPVIVSGTPQLALATGSPASTSVAYTSGSGTSVLTFKYTVAAGNTSSDLDYASTSSLTLPGGATIRDAAGNNTATTLPTPGSASSLAGTKALVIDTAAPTVLSVSSSASNGSFKAGTTIPVTVTFTEPVVVSGTPRLTLETGSSDAVVDYTSGSGGSTLTFSYTVAAGHTSSDLDYLSSNALSLNGGSITDVATNAGVLTLPAPGGTGSLGANKNLVVDTTAPYVTSIDRNSSTPTNNGSLSWTVRFSESVSGVDTTDFSLAATLSASGSGMAVTGSGSTRTVTISTGSGDGTLRLDLTDDNSIQDTATNPLGASGGGTNGDFTGQSYTVDKTNPTVTINKAAAQADPTNSPSSIVFTAVFSETVSGFTAADVSITEDLTGSASVAISGSGPTYTVTVTGLSGNGSVTASIGANGVQDDAGNGNIASTSTDNTVAVDTAAPTLTKMEMFDRDTDGKVDQVVATFSESLASYTASTAPWTVANAPGGASNTLSSVAVNGNEATLTFNEGNVNTALGSFTIALAQNAAGIRDAAGNTASFAATAPTDKAAPIATTIASANCSSGCTAGKADVGDTVTVTFSENLPSLSSTTSTVTLSVANGNNGAVTLNITGLSASGFKIAEAGDYLAKNESDVVFAGTLSKPANNQIRVTFGTKSGSGTPITGSYASGKTGSFTPSTSVKDAAGNDSAGTLPITIGFF